MSRRLVALLAVAAGAVLPLVPATNVANALPEQEVTVGGPAAFDVSPPLSELVSNGGTPGDGGEGESEEERGPVVTDRVFTGDPVVQSTFAGSGSGTGIPATTANFEGINNDANAPFRPVPPDPVGAVGPNHYVEMVNVQLAIYSKTGSLVLGPTFIGTLFDGFPLEDCEGFNGDPVVLHDQLADRWILTQFTVDAPTYYNCIAVSATSDPTGRYYRYAYSTGANFPDYPKYGVWPNAYFGSAREFPPVGEEGAGVFALERSRMLNGDPGARQVHIFVPGGDEPWLVGHGLLPSDLDGSALPPAGSPNYYVGTMDKQFWRNAPFDGVNLFEFSVDWGGRRPQFSFEHTASIPVAPYDSIFPCDKGSRHCIPQPNTRVKIDFLGYRQRPTFRAAYRNFGDHESIVTSQSVEASPGVAGMRWYEIRQPGTNPVVYQQGTYAPNDGTNRWMGSVAMDAAGNMGLGYSVSSRVVYPGIRYTGRLASDPLGQMPLGEASVIEGSGVQLNLSGRWGDYTALTVDPTDDCTFWYVNEYYVEKSDRDWHTRIGAFRLPGCGA